MASSESTPFKAKSRTPLSRIYQKIAATADVRELSSLKAEHRRQMEILTQVLRGDTPLVFTEEELFGSDESDGVATIVKAASGLKLFSVKPDEDENAGDDTDLERVLRKHQEPFVSAQIARKRAIMRTQEQLPDGEQDGDRLATIRRELNDPVEAEPQPKKVKHSIRNPFSSQKKKALKTMKH
jgi:hypothetical protein